MKFLIVTVFSIYSLFTPYNNIVSSNTSPTPIPLSVNTQLTGKWVFTFKTSRKDRIYETTLTQQDNIATGKIKGSLLTIYIDGNNVKFTNRRKTPIGEMIMNYTGIVKENTMSGTYVMEKGPGAGSINDWHAERIE